MKSPDILITLLGSNPLVPVTSIKFLATQSTKIYVLHTEDTADIVTRIQKWGKKGKYDIEGVELEPFNTGDIANNLKEIFVEKSLTGLIHFETTGGTKPMLLGSLLSLQEILSDESEMVISYIVNYPWQLSVTDLSDLNTTNIPISLKFKINEIIALHQDHYKSRNPSNIKSQTDFSEQIAIILSQSNGANKWRQWKKDQLDQCFKANGRVKPKSQLSHLNLSFSVFSNLSEMVHPKIANIPLEDLKNNFNFRAKGHLVDWLNGFWLETYVTSVFNKDPLKSIVDDIKVNVEAQNPQFELDLIFLVKNQLFVLSISTTSDGYQGGKSALKKKIFEVIIRSRQIAGWKSNFGLVCLADNPKGLEKEVEDYLVDRKVRVFGRSDLQNLGGELKKWINR